MSEFNPPGYDRRAEIVGHVVEFVLGSLALGVIASGIVGFYILLYLLARAITETP